MGAIIPAGVLLAILALIGASAKPAPGPGPGPGPGPTPGPEPRPVDPDPSFDDVTPEEIADYACVLWLSRSVTATIDGLSLALVRGTFPQQQWPGPQGSNRDRLLKRVVAVFEQLQAGTLRCDAEIVPEDTPRAGGYYQIRKGDTPFGIITKAYPQLAGNAQGQAQKRIQAVKMVTNNAKNGGGKIGQGIIVATVGAGNINLIGPAVFSMYPKWYCGPRVESERFAAGSCYAVVYLPEI